MNEGLLNILDEQSAMGFTGKVNVLKSANAQSFAVILMLEGKIINCMASARSGEKALLDVIFKDVSNTEAFKVVVEPEVVSEAEGTFSWSVSQLKKESRRLYENYLNNKQLKPPGQLKLVINGQFIVRGDEILADEFDVLSTISDYSRVQDIYNNCDLMEYEVTRALVGLRRKGAIKVLAK
ncbi:MAG: hypothetical protein CME71_07450 [Halobacteriovorax sp.]|nr:hypothetical protein [Halobacteriovorax sp.]|tara:strand:- start:142 stop:684 length:543 start_codon:yes stop_codon:yes gene_type:complete